MGSPILIYRPGGGVPSGGGPSEVADAVTGQGITQLVNGQSYIAVTFGLAQTDAEWIFVECSVVNTTDTEPLNIWPGIITAKTASGFTLQLNGLPDSSNYYLHWAISGVSVEPIEATTYFLSGPATGGLGEESTVFTVALPSSTFVDDPVIVTPDDGGAGGTFAPTSVTLTTSTLSATFTYTPASSGTQTISVTNDGFLTDPASLTYTVLAATGYSMVGPTSGSAGVASTNFMVTLTPAGLGVPAPVTVTPSDGGGGGTFTPTSVTLSTGTPSATFTYTPASGGAKTISATNSGSLTNPANLTYTASAPDVFTDNFTGAGPTALSAHTADTGQSWQSFRGAAASDIFVTGNSLGGSSTSTADLCSSFQPVADCEATITIIKGSITGTPEVGIWLRLIPEDITDLQGYLGRFIQGSGWQIARYNAAALTSLTGSLPGTIANGDILRFTVSGTGATVALNLYQNGTLVATATDTATARILGSGFVGAHLFDSTGGSAGVNYRIDKISSPTASVVPTTIAGLRGWWQADSLLLADGAAVSNWLDNSGTLHDLTSGTLPIFKTNIVNGRPVVRFNGTSHSMAAADAIASNYTVFAVVSAASISAGSHTIMAFGGVASAFILRRDAATLNQFHYTGAYSNVAEASGIVAATWNVITADWDGANIHMWRNGVAKGSAAAATITSTGSNLSVGSDFATGNFWDGDIAEVLVYNVALSTTDRQAVEAYLRAKYGTP